MLCSSILFAADLTMHDSVRAMTAYQTCSLGRTGLAYRGHQQAVQPCQRAVGLLLGKHAVNDIHHAFQSDRCLSNVCGCQYLQIKYKFADDISLWILGMSESGRPVAWQTCCQSCTPRPRRSQMSQQCLWLPVPAQKGLVLGILVEAAVCYTTAHERSTDAGHQV